ncbi:MAG: exodeoxyribonuclease V subunit gamma, partial [Rhodocyclaceae bacterium]|nr:exodeoxyribonuclease V subunit gamma [Rhodocyclaceae bacterium]
QEAHSWRAGIQRLLLGVALPDAPERLFEGQLPVPGIEGEHAERLGRFLDFATALFELHGKVGAGRTAMEWCDLLLEALERCIVADEEEAAGQQRVRSALLALAESARTASCTSLLPLSVILRELEALLAARAPARAFAGGAATIAALRPGRPLPARVVCLVGMNDGAWPRPQSVPSFDLIAAQPRAGDRDRRHEERYAFLEALLCARDALIITFTGHDPRSNLAMPPAAILAELVDTLAKMTGCKDEALIVRHPLQPFSPAYFDGRAAALYSYDAEQCAASARLGRLQPAAAFCVAAGGEQEQAPAEVELADLLSFFAHPAKHFLRRRLGIHLEESEELLDIHEPFVPDRREAHRLRAAHLEALRAGLDGEEATRLLAARGWLPHGVAGALVSEAAAREARPLWLAAQPWAAAAQLPPVPVKLEIGGMRLVGLLEGLSANGLWRLQAGNAHAKHRLRLWIEHLVWQIVAPDDLPRTSALIARDGVIELAALADPWTPLADLLALYRRGAAAPLPFYPDTAWAWLEGKSGWRAVWQGGEFSDRPGEGQDPYWRLALRDSPDDPFGLAFEQTARFVLVPLFTALGKPIRDG